jgi:hypothetical protein
MTPPLVYFVPGRGERLEGNLGRHIQMSGAALVGREILGDFERLPFADQIAVIRDDLDCAFWQPEVCLVGRSFGAYLLLHTLLEKPPFPGGVLLFSPVLGPSILAGGRYGLRPPRADKLLRMAEAGQFPMPANLEIHTGMDDGSCDPALARRFAAAVGLTNLFLLDGMDHELPGGYVEGIIRRVLG